MLTQIYGQHTKHTRSCSEQWRVLLRRCLDRSDRLQGAVRPITAGKISDETYER
jgi:hypothetical protein